MLPNKSGKTFCQRKLFLFMLFTAFIGTFCSFYGRPGMAEDNMKTLSLGEIVVTGTRSEQKIEDVPAYVSVINSRQIERRNILSLDEALRRQSGLSSLMVQDMAGASRQISLRGFRGQGRTQILFNGHPLKTAVTMDKLIGRDSPSPA